ncbi:phage tail protein [Acetobacter nitrogenifigens DSM 23921 = NBRC 105050]|uniref:Phage tail protein n=1 Tax=Acetobacter nitrogenifigens DSM 23921 = NBRC 105050 TaxID=1120919 RepID=A0A511X8V5_9PROT|nr:hypothetical protein [Acetobacter nitrogenifigens]GBQ87300.1 phage tail protein [Acetobacter nitrogenifigens DSM 23921 = NBRC 105050]GEN59387.1 hypothetical protein ANI02nite_12710 [Acetobacter nitrogenifigens DSM 23921 = NBRC 105050]
MPDVYHVPGSDLTLGSSGDIAVASGVDASNQRILRRLATNAGDYIFSLDYGAGLPGRVGGADVPADLETLISQQIQLEASVSSTPAPIIAVTRPRQGSTRISITYTNTETGGTVALEL